MSNGQHVQDGHREYSRDPSKLRYFKRCKAALDTRPFLKELEVNEDLWYQDTARQRKVRVQRETESIFLVGADTKLEPGKPVEDVQACVEHKNIHHFPVLANFLYTFSVERGSALQRTIVVRLQPKGKVYPHIDHGDYYRVRDRYHLVLDSPKGSVLTAEKETVVMQQGELWWFDNKAMHESDNPADDWRTHVIFDLLPHNRL